MSWSRANGCSAGRPGRPRSRSIGSAPTGPRRLPRPGRRDGSRDEASRRGTARMPRGAVHRSPAGRVRRSRHRQHRSEGRWDPSGCRHGERRDQRFQRLLRPPGAPTSRIRDGRGPSPQLRLGRRHPRRRHGARALGGAGCDPDVDGGARIVRRIETTEHEVRSDQEAPAARAQAVDATCGAIEQHAEEPPQ